MKVLLIRWLDHQSMAGWIEKEDTIRFCAEEGLEAISVGIEVYQDSDHIVIAQTQTPATEMRGDLLKVLKTCVKQIKTIYMEK